MNLFVFFLYKKYSSYLKRGYLFLKSEDLLFKLHIINSDISEGEISFYKSEFFYRYIYPEFLTEISVRQFLITKLLGRRLNIAIILGCRGRIIFPLPKSWIHIIESHGFKVNRVLSRLLWTAFILYFLALAFVKNIKLFLHIASTSLLKRNSSFRSGSVFVNLTKNNLPKDISDSSSRNIINWFLYKSNKRITNAWAFTSHDKILNNLPQFLAFPIPISGNILFLLSFLRSTIYYSILAILFLFVGRWEIALMLNEMVLYQATLKSKSDYLADNYFFNNSEWIYRPLWTYAAEQLGAKIFLYFYSTNCENFLENSITMNHLHYGYSSMNWPNYYVWDSRQESFIKSCNDFPRKIFRVGPIWFSDSCDDLNFPTPISIAIFDVQPMDDIRYLEYAFYPDYYTAENCIDFLRDIIDIGVKYNIKLLLKHKRDIGKIGNSAYYSFVQSKVKSNSIELINSDISPFRIIPNVSAVISMPFTSTGIVAKDANVYSVYYDPTGSINRSNPCSRDVEIINNLEKLDSWIASLNSSNQSYSL